MTRVCDDNQASVAKAVKESKHHEALKERGEAGNIAEDNVISNLDIDDALFHANVGAQAPEKNGEELDSQAIAVDVSERIAHLKQQEKEKLTELLTELKAQAALMSTSMVAPSDKAEQRAPLFLDGLRLRGALLSPVEGMQKIKAVHQIGLGGLLGNISDTLPFADDEGEEA
ncbi:hypothetical protein [uncultured Shewanella sp.]|uniref:hypothetical protein n=1 Tax=uncultured Shewanella sp. TaxID=173975 RepID=UPI002633F0AF|nr:hypothetical protein [uncultured Shewanella sp.]